MTFYINRINPKKQRNEVLESIKIKTKWKSSKISDNEIETKNSRDYRVAGSKNKE